MILIICILAAALVAVSVGWWKTNMRLKLVSRRLEEQNERRRDAGTVLRMAMVDSSMTYKMDEYFQVFDVLLVKTIGSYEYPILIKSFPKLDDPDFARLQAEELLEKLQER